MGVINSDNLVKLQCTFPMLSELNQHYVLGLAEGLKQAQGKNVKLQDKKVNASVDKIKGDIV
jgi:hypothetical protein